MKRDGDLVARVLAAKRDPRCADDLVRDYLPFIKAETAKFMGRSPQRGRDDELGIAMFAFHEAVLSYDRARGGAFLAFASMSMRHRLLDFARRERRHADVISLDERRSDGGDGDGRPLAETIASERDELDERQARDASRQEIIQFGAELGSFGLTLLDVPRTVPSSGARSRRASASSIARARTRSCSIACCRRGGCPWQSSPAARGWRERR